MTAPSRRKMTLMLTGTALAAAALLTAGCGPNSASAGSSTSGSGTGQAAAGSGGSAPTAAPSAASTAAASPSASAATPPATAAPGGSGSGTPGTAKSDCTMDDLKVTLGDGNGAAGSTYIPVVFTNKSGGTCAIQGFPGVSLANSGGQIGAAATRDPSRSSALITLAPGAKASAQLRVTDARNYPSGTCKPDTSTFLKVYPPNLTASTDVPLKTSGCQSKSVKLLQVQPLVKGSGS